MTSHCTECGAAVAVPKSGPTGSFCSSPCRQAHRNRRMRRGAIAYDLLMNWRFQRGKKGGDAALKTLCRAAATWNQEDKAERGGRKSYRMMAVVVMDYPEFQSIDMV